MSPSTRRSGSRESIPRVASGTYDIGTGDVNSLIRFRDENPVVDLKAVMMVYDRPPFAIVGRKSKGVTADPKSLAGKKLGAPAADGAYAQWPIFRSVNKLDDAAMKFENVGFPVREPMLASGEVDAVFGFSFSVYMNLKSRGVPVDDIVLILMSDHGVELYGNVLMVSPKFAAEKPEAVKGFIKALTKGLRDTVADPGRRHRHRHQAQRRGQAGRGKGAARDVAGAELRDTLGQGQRLRRHRQGALRQVHRPDRSHLQLQVEAEGGGHLHRGVPAAARRAQGELMCIPEFREAKYSGTQRLRCIARGPGSRLSTLTLAAGMTA